MTFNDGLTETKAVSIVDVSSEPAILTHGGKTYTLKKLSLGDYSACQQYIRARKLEALDEATKHLSEELRARTMAEILIRPMALLDIWNEFEGEIIMLQRGLLLDGKQLTVEYIRDAMDPCDRKYLAKVLLHICGLAADPTPVGKSKNEEAQTTTLPDQNNGTTNSENSADITNGVAPENSST